MKFTVRAMQRGDLPAILALQEHAYAGADFEPERAEVYLNRMTLAPDYCLVAVRNDGGLGGYLVSHPWNDSVPPQLDAILARLPHPAGCWYLHDCAVDSRERGSGVAARLRTAGLAVARTHGLKAGALVAVGRAASYWSRHGYRRRELPGLAAKLAAYGPEAVYMVCEL